MDLIDDDRSDAYASAFTQAEFSLTPKIRIIGAARFDEGDLFDSEFSPKGAVVFSPNERHSFRFTVNRALQTPSVLEFYLRVPAAAPTTPQRAPAPMGGRSPSPSSRRPLARRSV